MSRQQLGHLGPRLLERPRWFVKNRFIGATVSGYCMAFANGLGARITGLETNI